MQLLDGYPAMPGQCFGCGNSQDRKVLDTERDIDFYGRVYFCELCGADIARRFNVTPPVAEKIELEDLSEHVFRVSSSIDRLGDIVTQLSSLATVDESQEFQNTTTDEIARDISSGTTDRESAQLIAASDDNVGDEGSASVSERNGDDSGTDRIPEF